MELYNLSGIWHSDGLVRSLGFGCAPPAVVFTDLDTVSGKLLIALRTFPYIEDSMSEKVELTESGARKATNLTNGLDQITNKKR